ncbi:WD40 repeat-like protein [Poronia punctata]|nr:WD40 repeat-like protein [Poronia punctata]
MSDKKPGRLRRDYVLSPITALAFLGNEKKKKKYLLAAEDTDIKIYDLATNELCGCVRVFDAQSIHGIVVDDDEQGEKQQQQQQRILVWGGNVVKVLDGGDVLNVRDVDVDVPETVAPDWIFDARFLPSGSGSGSGEGRGFVLLTAHNEVIQGEVGRLGRVSSPSRPILYSGSLSFSPDGDVLVAAGTVFGEIVVWRCELCSGKCEVLFVFSGHEGSIFGVDISSEMRLGSSGEVVRLLASCSDDRTIRIWDITERSSGDGREIQISDARQTGFGDSIVGSVGRVDDDDSSSSSRRCVAMAMGHVSRIWRVEIRSQKEEEGGVDVYSFGEDATMQRWELKLDGLAHGDGELAAELVHRETFSNHSGKQIWSHAMISTSDGLLIATGGGDGKIALVRNDATRPSEGNSSARPRAIQEESVAPDTLIETCQSQDGIGAHLIPSFKHANGKEMFQSFAFLSHDRLILTTRSGRVFVGIFENTITWTELSIPDDIRKAIQSYTILRCSRTVPLAFIGATNGDVFLYNEAAGDTLDHSSRSDGDSEAKYVQLLITVFGSNKAEIVGFYPDRHTSTTTTTTTTKEQIVEVTLPEDFIVTTAAWCYGHLVLGSRNGSIVFLNKQTSEPAFTTQVTVGDKITSILPLPRRTKKNPYFVTTSRDGRYRIYEILSGDGIRLVHETKPPFGPLIESSWLSDSCSDNDLILCGFRSRFFVVWNATRQEEMAAFDCGGGHRVYDYTKLPDNPEGVRFACTKASQMKVYSQTRLPHTPLKTGGHGREIRAVAASPSTKYVATGAEDTMIRIWQEEDGEKDGRRRCVHALERHNTGIQKLKWCGDEYLFSSGGNEEFFAWRVTAIHDEDTSSSSSSSSPPGIVCEGVFTYRSEVGDLRIMDFDVRKQNHNHNHNHNGNENDDEFFFYITMALSNSTIQSYVYSASKGFIPQSRRMYTGACLTQIRHLNNDERYVLVAATDGHLAIFDMKKEEEEDPILVTKIHQSTIKSLDISPGEEEEKEGSLVVVTGGDDNAIGITRFRFCLCLCPSTNTYTYKVLDKSIIRSAHAAAVTGLAIIPGNDDDDDRGNIVVTTTGNDQRVKTWRIVDHSSSLRVQLLDDQYSGVADAGDLEVIGREKKVLVAGVGMEVWDVS